jgi:glycine/D-amino acid oxidase-like deaminating enzyme
MTATTRIEVPPNAIPAERASLARSLWEATVGGRVSWPQLEAPRQETDVAIIGAGITGLSAALHLAERGIGTVVLDAQSPGWGASGRNGGQVLPGLKEDPDAIETIHGSDLGGRMLRLAGNAPDELFGLIQRHAIACDPVRGGWVQPAHSAETLAASRERVRQWQRRGAPLESLSRQQLADILGTDAYVGGALDRRAGSVHPLNLSLGMAATVTRLGGIIHGRSPVTSIARDPAGGFRVTAGRGAVHSRQLLICTNGYTPPAAGSLRRSVIPVCSIAVASQPIAPELRANVLRNGEVVSDMFRLLNHYRFDPEGRLLMGGRGGYTEGAIATQFARLKARVHELYGDRLGELRWEYAWGGNVAVTTDHFPHLNRLGDGMYAALGYNGRGVAMATVLGRLLAELASGTPEQEIPFPVTPVRNIPLHGLYPVGAGAAILWNALLDQRQRRASRALQA